LIPLSSRMGRNGEKHFSYSGIFFSLDKCLLMGDSTIFPVLSSAPQKYRYVSESG
jgi:hypothetical protein